MRTVNIHEAKTHLPRLLEEAVNGDPFIIAKAGKPLVTVTKITTSQSKPMRRTGFLSGQFPTTSTRWGSREIERLFEGRDE